MEHRKYSHGKGRDLFGLVLSVLYALYPTDSKVIVCTTYLTRYLLRYLLPCSRR
jgi:hypothetical protein